MRKPPRDALESVDVFLVERGTPSGVDIQYRQQRAGRIKHRHHDLGSCSGIAANVPGIKRDIGNDDGTTLGRGRSADATSELDIETPKGSLVRPDAEQSRSHDTIETGPEMAKCVVNERDHRRHPGDIVIGAGEHRDQVCVQLRVRPGLWYVTQVQRDFGHNYLEIIEAYCRSITRSATP